jgi:hypothetical protein
MSDKKNDNIKFVPLMKVMELYNPLILENCIEMIVQTKIN